MQLAAVLHVGDRDTRLEATFLAQLLIQHVLSVAKRLRRKQLSVPAEFITRARVEMMQFTDVAI